MKLILNDCHGGYGLSPEAVLRISQLKGITLYPEDDDRFGGHTPSTYWLVPVEQRVHMLDQEEWMGMTLEQRLEHNAKHLSQIFNPRKIPRNDPHLVQVVEELGDKANGRFAKLRVVEIDASKPWFIDDSTGKERVVQENIE